MNTWVYVRPVSGGWQAVQAAQITFEDFFLSEMDISPLKIVGFEGLWGSAAMVLLLLPLVQFLPGKEGAGIHEDTIESLYVGDVKTPNPSPQLRFSLSVLQPGKETATSMTRTGGRIQAYLQALNP